MLVGGSKIISKNSISCNPLLNTTLESLDENGKQSWQIDFYRTVPNPSLSPQIKKEN